MTDTLTGPADLTDPDQLRFAIRNAVTHGRQHSIAVQQPIDDTVTDTLWPLVIEMGQQAAAKVLADLVHDLTELADKLRESERATGSAAEFQDGSWKDVEVELRRILKDAVS